MYLLDWLLIEALTMIGSPSVTDVFSRQTSKSTRPGEQNSGRLTAAAGGIQIADFFAEPCIWITSTSKRSEFLLFSMITASKTLYQSPLKSDKDSPFVRLTNATVDAKHFKKVLDPARIPSELDRLLDKHAGPDVRRPFKVKRVAGVAVHIMQLFLHSAPTH